MTARMFLAAMECEVNASHRAHGRYLPPTSRGNRLSTLVNSHDSGQGKGEGSHGNRSVPVHPALPTRTPIKAHIYPDSAEIHTPLTDERRRDVGPHGGLGRQARTQGAAR